VLSWEVYEGRLALLFATGRITEKLFAIAIKEPMEDEPRSIADIRREWGDEVAAAVEHAGPVEKVVVRTDVWEQETRQFPVQVLLHAEDVDWESGVVSGTFDRSSLEGVDDFFEDLLRQHPLSELQVELSDMCFELADIEMMAPGGEVPKRSLVPDAPSPKIEAPRPGGPGRRREHDWEGALFYLLGEAEKNAIAPEPEARGAQADIKVLLADWFSANGGRVPSESQLEVYARKALDAIRRAKP
jgi:hypothetical protein